MKPTPDDLLAWYDRHRRVLPWRYMAGQAPDPYRVWLSEVMLQQTTVATVIPYYESFLKRWPTVEALAQSTLDDVLTAWAGLGYYARARHLYRCAQHVFHVLKGTFPASESDLLQLPGIGPYTAAAISSIAFDLRATAIDGNVKRVICRVFGIDQPPPAADPLIQQKAQALTPHRRNGDYTQALMELGALVCTPRQPKCGECPWQKACVAYKTGRTEALPVKAEKKKLQGRFGLAFWLVDKKGAVWLRRRPETGLLGGMLEVPSTDWIARRQGTKRLLGKAPVPVEWRVLPGSVRHVFSHFPLELQVAYAQLPNKAPRPEGVWIHPKDLDRHALPTVMKKVARHALDLKVKGN